MGDDGLALGLFSSLPAAARNVITGRFGNINMMADTKVPIEYAGKLRPAHLFDMKSRPDLSGSPIFVYRTPSSDLRLVDQGPRHPTYNNEYLRHQTYWRDRENIFLKLLGIHSTQYTDSIQVTRDCELVDETNGPIRDGDCLRIPNSMSVVAPADSVKILLNSRPFAAVREKRNADEHSYRATT